MQNIITLQNYRIIQNVQYEIGSIVYESRINE